MNRLYFVVFLFFLLTAFSCNDRDKRDISDAEFVEVGLNITYEGVLMPQFSATLDGSVPTSDRTTPARDLYAVQLYFSLSPDGALSPYAFGLFDNTDNIKVKIQTNKYYKMTVSCVKEGSEKLWRNATNGFGKPFEVAGNVNGIGISNELAVISTNYFKALSLGEAQFKGSDNSYKRPMLDRYYGESATILCQNQTQFNVDLKRVVFGLDINTHQFEKGKIKILVGDANEYIMNAKERQTLIYTFLGGKSGNWVGETYTETVSVSMFYNDGTSDNWKIIGISKNIPFTRRHSYEIEVTPSGGSIAGLSFESDVFLEGGQIDW